MHSISDRKRGGKILTARTAAGLSGVNREWRLAPREGAGSRQTINVKMAETIARHLKCSVSAWFVNPRELAPGFR
jgi:hypothetical protein